MPIYEVDNLIPTLADSVYIAEAATVIGKATLCEDVSVWSGAVIRADKVTTKVRIVFDASCKDNGVSLNDTLHKGIPRFTELFNVLQKIRVHKWVLFSDIEKAFYQIHLREMDKDLLRLLWRDEQGEQQVFRFRRVCFGLVPSMTLLGNVLKTHLGKFR